VFVDHSSINRWSIWILPALEKVFRKHKRPVGVSWRMDETYIKVKGIWKYLLQYQNRGSDLRLGIHMTYGKILITDASGQIGRVLRTGLRGKYQLLRLLDITPLGQAETGEELVQADIRDMAALEKAMEGIECVVHLAGIPVEGPWETVRDLNIDGCYKAYEAARRQGVRRFIFTSSNHAVGFHKRENLLDDSVVPRPDTRYGVSKVFGEALGRLYADKHGLSVACPAHRHVSRSRCAAGITSVAVMGQSPRYDATGAASHRPSRLPLHRGLRGLQQPAQSLEQ